MTVFDGLASAMGSLIGSTPEVGGFILGFVTIVAILIIVTWTLPEIRGPAMLIPIGIAVAFVSLVDWWPKWTIIVIALFVALALFHPWSETATP